MYKSGELLAAEAYSLLRNLNGNIDSAKYQIDIIHDIEIACKCDVFSQKGYIFVPGLAPCHNTKSTRIFLEW